MKHHETLFTCFVVPALLFLSACGGSSSSDPAPIVREEGTSSQQDSFPTFSITFPPELEVALTRNVDIDSDDPQISIQAAIFRDEERQTIELLCQLTVTASDLESAEQANMALFESTSYDIISTDPIQNGERSGIEILYSENRDDGEAISGLAHVFYFDATADNLERSSTFVIECLGLTQTFNNRRALVNQVLDSVRFGSGELASNGTNTHWVFENGNFAPHSGL